jgi:DNA adenine methylase
MPKPLLKWVGGKTKLLKHLSLYIPRHYTNYVEPFIGGGALLFNINPKIGVINDTNRELINFYNQVRDNPIELLTLTKVYEVSEKEYYVIRNDDREIDWRDSKSCLERAARFLYLNKTAFNGIWRVNAKGIMNTPYGNYEKVLFPTPGHMLEISKILRRLTILNTDFNSTLSYVTKDTFVYLDPPYIPYSTTANFTNYSSKGFSLLDQQRLVDYCVEINNIGGKFLLSNSDTPITRDLFRKFEINAIDVYHSVGASSASRKDKGEVIIRNYEGSCTGLFL